jgi:zinc protease
VERLPNGLTVLLQRHGTLPVTAFDLHLPAGMLVEAKPGVAALVGDLLDDGAGERSAEQIAETVDFLGATLATDATGARVRCLSKDADAVLDLLADVVLRPRFEASEFEKAVRTHLTELAAEDENPVLVGRKAFLKAVYGDHPYGRRPNGDPATLRTVTREDVAAHHAKWFVPDRAILAVAGDFDPGAMLAAVERRFGSWKPGGAAPPALPAPPAIAATVRIDVPMEGKTQSNVHIGSLAIRRTDPDYAALLVLDHVLGTAPGFSDRLSRDLRDEKGLAYSVWGNATRSAAEEPGTWTGYIACLGDDLPRAVEGILGHMRRIRDEPVSPGELEDAKSYLVGSQVFRYETTEQVAAELVGLQRFGLGFDYPARFPALVGAVTREDVQRVARKYLRPDACAIVVSGYVGK